MSGDPDHPARTEREVQRVRTVVKERRASKVDLVPPVDLGLQLLFDFSLW